MTKIYVDNKTFDLDELRAMDAALERLDPALIPGLTADQRSALSRYARPALPAAMPPASDVFISALTDAIMDGIRRHGVVQDYLQLVRSALITAAGRIGARLVRHKKRGSVYNVLGFAEAQVSKGTMFLDASTRVKAVGRELCEGDFMTVYRDDTGKLWLRFPDEFEDGRFEDLANAPIESDT